MTPIAGPLGALVVATIFYAYREYLEGHRRKEQRLRQRIAYMLWVAAHA